MAIYTVYIRYIYGIYGIYIHRYIYGAYTVYIQYSRQGFHQICGHARRIHTVMANPSYY